MRRAWPPVYRPPSQHKVVTVAAAPQTTTTITAAAAAAARYRRDTVAAGATCFVIAAPCSCSPPPQTSAMTVRNHQQQQQYSMHPHHRGPPPPLPARNSGVDATSAGGCTYRCCVAPVGGGRAQKLSPQSAPSSQQQPLHMQQYYRRPLAPQQQRPCAYVRPRPSRSLENLLRVVELDDTGAAAGGHRGVYEKSCHYGSPRRKMKVPGKENRHAWKRRSMESLLSARDAAAVAVKNFEYFRHVSRDPRTILVCICLSFSSLSFFSTRALLFLSFIRCIWVFYVTVFLVFDISYNQTI